MKNIGVLGGSFNPIHEGHLQLAEFATLYFDEVWLMPAYSHPHGKEILGTQHRINMASLGVRNRHHKIILSGYEVQHKIEGGTYETLCRLKKEYPDWNFSFIVGQDNADTLDTWRQADELRDAFPFLVIPRKGYPRNFSSDAWFSKGHHQYISHVDEKDAIMQISSTEIREMLSRGEKPDEIADWVFKYIKEHQLYGYKDVSEQLQNIEGQAHSQ